jgi:hypothetical protein
MIATEGEMKKVNWVHARKSGATKVVTVTVSASHPFVVMLFIVMPDHRRAGIDVGYEPGSGTMQADEERTPEQMENQSGGAARGRLAGEPCQTLNNCDHLPGPQSGLPGEVAAPPN